MSDASIELVFKGLQVLVTLASMALNVYLFFKARQDERLKALERQVKDIDHSIGIERSGRQHDYAQLHNRVATLEEWRKHVPTHEDIDEIRKELGSIARTTAAVDERSETTLEGVRRIEQFLMERGNR